MLWFDLATKVREEIKVLSEPIYHMVYEQEKHLADNDKTMKEQG